MEYRITVLEPKQLIGKSKVMSFENDQTKELWQSFMPFRNNISNRVDDTYYSMQIYPNDFSFKNLDPKVEFTKWAAVEVECVETLDSEMDTYNLQGGLYAVFKHYGPASAASSTYAYIFTQWLPNSVYVLDQREHFEVLPHHYDPMDPNASEDIWIPIKSMKRLVHEF